MFFTTSYETQVRCCICKTSFFFELHVFYCQSNSLCFSLCLLSVVALMFSADLVLSVRKFLNLRFIQCLCKYLNILTICSFDDFRIWEGGLVLTVCDRNELSWDTFAWAWFKRWLHWRGHDISVSCCVSYEANMSLVCFCEEAEYKRSFLDRIWSGSVSRNQEISLSFVVVRRPFFLFPLIDRGDYWLCDCAFEFR